MNLASTRPRRAIATAAVRALCYHAALLIRAETTLMELTSAQIKRLRAESHRLNMKPIVIIGQKGMSENLHKEIELALDHHEMFKLRIPGLEKAAKRELAQQICAQHDAQLIQSIGNVIVIFRPNPETNRFAALVG